MVKMKEFTVLQNIQDVCPRCDGYRYKCNQRPAEPCIKDKDANKTRIKRKRCSGCQLLVRCEHCNRNII